MDCRDYAAEHGPWWKSLPEAEVNERKMELTFVLEDDEGEGVAHELPLKYQVCGVCRGKGHHVNPSIDADCGLTQEDFEREGPQFREDYFSGVYDVTCYGCGGKRVEFEIDEEKARRNGKEALLKAIGAWLDDEYEYRSLCAAERRMGA